MTIDEDITPRLRLVGDRLLRWEQHGYYWGDAIAYDALLAADQVLDAGWTKQIVGRLQRWNDTAPDTYDDALVPLRPIAHLVASGDLPEQVLHRAVGAITRLPVVDGVPLLRPHVPGWRTLVWVDSVYHLPAGLIAAGAVLDQRPLEERGIEIALRTCELLATDDAVGHAYDSGLEQGNGVDWTRGIGWALLGLRDACGLVRGHPDAEALQGQADRLAAALASSQRPNGHWPTVLGRDDADDETSVAGFWLAADLHDAAPTRRDDVSMAALEGLIDRIAPDGAVEGVSHDTHVRWGVDDYLSPPTQPSPWGQGAALRGLTAWVNSRAGLR